MHNINRLASSWVLVECARESGGSRSLLEAEECFRDFHFGDVAAFMIGAKRERRMLDVHLKLNRFVLQ